MKIISKCALCLGIAALLTACAKAEPNQSEFCVLVGKNSDDTDEVIAFLDSFAEKHGFLRGEEGPGGILYGNASRPPDFVISVTPMGPIGVEVSFHPRQPHTFNEGRLALEEYATNVVAENLEVILCDKRDGYRKGVIYGYDGIRI